MITVNDKRPAFLGLDKVRDANLKPLTKTRAGWQRWAARRAEPGWNAVVAYIEDRDAYRINYGR